MDDLFSIEIEVEETERKIYLEKLCNLFMQKGFIIEREWENNVELTRPLPISSPAENMMYPWIDKIYIQGDRTNITVTCSTKNYRVFRYLILFIVPVVDAIIITIFFFVVKERIVLIPLIFMLITSFFIIYFLFKMQFKNMMKLLAEEVQNL